MFRAQDQPKEVKGIQTHKDAPPTVQQIEDSGYACAGLLADGAVVRSVVAWGSRESGGDSKMTERLSREATQHAVVAGLEYKLE